MSSIEIELEEGDVFVARTVVSPKNATVKVTALELSIEDSEMLRSKSVGFWSKDELDDAKSRRKFEHS